MTNGNGGPPTPASGLPVKRRRKPAAGRTAGRRPGQGGPAREPLAALAAQAKACPFPLRRPASAGGPRPRRRPSQPVARAHRFSHQQLARALAAHRDHHRADRHRADPRRDPDRRLGEQLLVVQARPGPGEPELPRGQGGRPARRRARRHRRLRGRGRPVGHRVQAAALKAQVTQRPERDHASPSRSARRPRRSSTAAATAPRRSSTSATACSPASPT